MLSAGCAQIQSAPVVNGWQTTAGLDSEYKVQPGDTIYTIAWVFGVSYKSIARLNDLQPPYSLQGIKLLEMPAPKGTGFVSDEQCVSSQLADASDVTASAQPRVAVQPNTPAKQTGSVHIKWLRPTSGPVVAKFKSGNPPNKGIDFAGDYGQPVLASAAGEVVYSGAGLQGYGNLIIIKHAHDFMTAYGYNSSLLVKLGARVRAGQKIATVGRGPSGQPLLHFEIRKDGSPVNPTGLLRK